MADPFLSFYTPTYRRPDQLAHCLASVQQQTFAKLVEQVVIVDHIGVGVGGAFAAVPRYAAALHGEYVHFLCDDDVLAGVTVVGQLKRIIDSERDPYGKGPEVVIVGSRKPGGYYPAENHGPPVEGSIDLGCGIIRRDFWTLTCDQYGRRYEGDYDHLSALWRITEASGGSIRWSWHRELHFCTGAASRGRYEGQWP